MGMLVWRVTLDFKEKRETGVSVANLGEILQYKAEELLTYVGEEFLVRIRPNLCTMVNKPLTKYFFFFIFLRLLNSLYHSKINNSMQLSFEMSICFNVHSWLWYDIAKTVMCSAVVIYIYIDEPARERVPPDWWSLRVCAYCECDHLT